MKFIKKGLLPAILTLCLSALMVPTQAIGSTQNGQEQAIKNLKSALVEFKAQQEKNSTKPKISTLSSSLKSVSIKKITPKSGARKVSWTKLASSQQKRITGYQILWSTSKNMKNAGTKNVKKTSTQGKNCSVVINKLISKKKYYVRIRTYKKYNWGNDYSSWSSIKTATTKSSNSIVSASGSLSSKSMRYTGNPLKPKLTLKLNGKTLRSGIDYTVNYKNNVLPGTAQIVATGKGSYRGSKTFNFSIWGIDELTGIYNGVASSTEGISGLYYTPSYLINWERFGFWAKTNFTFEMYINYNKYPGRYEFYKSKDGTRYYMWYLNNGLKYFAGLEPNGSLMAIEYYYEDIIMCFELY